MRFVRDIRAEDVIPGDYLEDEDKFVIEVSHTSTRVILKCAYEMCSYPSTSLIFEPERLVSISIVGDWA